MTDLDTTTAVPAATPQQRVAALVAAIKGLEPGDVGAAYRLEEIDRRTADRYTKYVHNLIRCIGLIAVRKRRAGGAIGEIWRRVLDDIVKNEKRINGDQSR
jgi:hypothetical protein